MTPTPQRLRPAVLVGLSLLVAAGGGCHLIFPFSSTATEPDAVQTSDAMIDAAPADIAPADTALADAALDQVPMDGGLDAPDLATDALSADQHLPPDQAQLCACSAADLNNSGNVDSADLALLAPCIGKPPTGACKVADTDSDGDVDGTDQLCLALWMFKTCS